MASHPVVAVKRVSVVAMASEGKGTLPCHSRDAEEVLASLQTTVEGLSEEEARKRLEGFGENVLPEAPRRHSFRRLLAQFNNALIYFLLVAAAAAFLLGHFVDTAVIIAVVLVNAVVGFVQEGRAERALEAIREIIAPQASVVREGRRRAIQAREIVPGDIVLLEAGGRVPADLRLTHARGLLIDEAPLTGESVAVAKQVENVRVDAPLGDRQDMAFSGTLVAAGQGIGVAVATGAATEIGRVGALLESVERLTTPLLRQIERFARRLTRFVLFGALLLFAFAVLLRSYDWVDALIAVVALAVGIVPEGLPAVITITLAIGVRRMAARNAAIRNLPAVETLGATSVICTDKTGTLTRNEMTARRVMTPEHELIASGSGYAPEGELAAEGRDDGAEAVSAPEWLLRCGLLCNDASLRETGGRWRAEGDPMEAALLTLAMKARLDPTEMRETWPRRDEFPFDAARRFMATLHSGPDGEPIIFVKGAPEALFDMARPAVDRDSWDRRIAAAGAEGERVLAFGMKRLERSKPRLELEDLRGDVEILGLVGFIDPPRREALAAIAECRAAGIAVKMITGDHAATALAIARQLDLADDPQVITGEELVRLTDEELESIAARTSVFARTSPEQKLRIVRALQANGLVVAMTGDGVNDAPSLKQADVGTAMGIKGTEAAKEAAQMVLLDDNFTSIVSAVREGRTVHDNIRKVITWEIPTNGGETLAVVLAILMGFALPMTATQILWINLVPAVTLGLVLAFEPSEPGIMRRPPRARDAPLLSPFLVWRVILVSMLLTIVALGVFFLALAQGRNVEVARTMVVNVFVVCEIFYLFNVRYLYMTSITARGALGTPAVLAAITILVAAQLLFTYAPFMNLLFDSRPLSIAEGLLIAVTGPVLMLLLEAEKLLLRRLGWFEELR